MKRLALLLVLLPLRIALADGPATPAAPAVAVSKEDQAKIDAIKERTRQYAKIREGLSKTCPTCQGSGKVPNGSDGGGMVPCNSCDGTGTKVSDYAIQRIVNDFYSPKRLEAEGPFAWKAIFKSIQANPKDLLLLKSFKDLLLLKSGEYGIPTVELLSPAHGRSAIHTDLGKNEELDWLLGGDSKRGKVNWYLRMEKYDGPWRYPDLFPAPDPYTVKQEYDPFTDMSSYRVTSLKTSEADTTVMASWTHRGQVPTERPLFVSMMAVRSGADWKYVSFHKISATAAGVPLSPYDDKHEGGVRAGGVEEFVSFKVSLPEFLRIAKAGTESIIRVGTTELKFGQPERVALIKLADTIPEKEDPK